MFFVTQTATSVKHEFIASRKEIAAKIREMRKLGFLVVKTQNEYTAEI